jgi:O-antigen ligase
MANRVATAVLQIGCIAVALVVLPYKLFELDRYFVPKELVLHVAALLLALLLFLRARSVTVDLADKLLAVFVAWSLVSALFATNYWIAQRALGVTVSSAIVFWAARYLGAQRSYRAILIGASIATMCAVATALAQAYGLESDYFSLNRAPGGTFGNRNFVAHFGVIGLPALVFVTVTARSSFAAMLGAVGAAAVSALLVLSRTRAAWLGLVVSVICVALPLIASRRYWKGHHVGARFWTLALASVVGACIAIAMPNRLRWASDSPYLESARNMVDYSSGSGRGRVAQYTNSLRMTASNPVFGVGPGNWPVEYVRYAPAGDKSLASNGMTANPWPSSDWVAFMSERGVLAALALLGVFALIFLSSLRHWSELPDSDAVLAKVTLIATVPATLVVGSFDAALLLGAPAMLAWSIIGATSGIGRAGAELRTGSKAWRAGLAVALLLVVVAIARSATQVVAITTAGEGGSRAGWITAASLDPGSYRINVRVAQSYLDRGRCSSARDYARRAAALFPSAAEPRRILRACR